MKNFRFGSTSEAKLIGVHPKLVAVVRRALVLSPQDFSVHDGLRDLETQRLYVARGASKTMNSKHLVQEDGYGHAVDLVPYVNGSLRWEWPLIYPIAGAMRTAAEEHGVLIRWGGSWSVLNGTRETPERLHTGWDGPHYELKL